MSFRFVLRFAASCLTCVSLVAVAESGDEAARADSAALAKIPRPDHVVIVVEENKSYQQIIGNSAAPYINALAARGALFTQSFAITYPSQPNYLALFAGTTHGVVDNKCPVTLVGDNLASELKKRGLSFAIFSESLPAPGYRGCESGHYFRKHNPVANWQNLGASPTVNLPFTSFPTDYTRLPTVSFVVPNQQNNMHDDESADGIRRADQWLQTNLGPFVEWALTHNSLLILTWDEDDRSADNRVPTVFVGAMVNRGVHHTRITHYNVLRTVVEMYDLQPMGETRQAAPITGIWAR